MPDELMSLEEARPLVSPDVLMVPAPHCRGQNERFLRKAIRFIGALDGLNDEEEAALQAAIEKAKSNAAETNDSEQSAPTPERTAGG